MRQPTGAKAEVLGIDIDGLLGSEVLVDSDRARGRSGDIEMAGDADYVGVPDVVEVVWRLDPEKDAIGGQLAARCENWGPTRPRKPRWLVEHCPHVAAARTPDDAMQLQPLLAIAGQSLQPVNGQQRFQVRVRWTLDRCGREPLIPVITDSGCSADSAYPFARDAQRRVWPTILGDLVPTEAISRFRALHHEDTGARRQVTDRLRPAALAPRGGSGHSRSQGPCCRGSVAAVWAPRLAEPRPTPPAGRRLAG